METTSNTSTTSDDIFEDFTEGANLELNDEIQEENKHSIIQDIRNELSSEVTLDSNGFKKSESFASVQSKDLNESLENLDMASDDYFHDKEWIQQRRHVFILSLAGKPIYSLHDNEGKLTTLCGTLQALVSFIQANQDTITSIIADGIKFVFLIKSSLILVAASRDNSPIQHLQMQLSDVYNQILSTLPHMTKIFEKRQNYDLRKQLAGTERLIDHLLDTTNKKITNNIFTTLTNSVQVLPLPLTVRNNITSAIQSNCSKIRDLVFAVLIANNKLIVLVRMKKYAIHPADLRLIFNLIECSESFKTAESWIPICLPKFDMNGYLYAHVSYLSDDCQACLLLLSVDQNVFSILSEAKKKITDKLRRSHCLEAINEVMNNRGINLCSIAITKMRHFLYKCKLSSQLLCAELSHPYSNMNECDRLYDTYCDVYHKIHNSTRPLKLIYHVGEKELVLAWVASAYELYAIFEPTIDRNLVIESVNKLVRWIEKEQDIIFIKNHPNF